MTSPDLAPDARRMYAVMADRYADAETDIQSAVTAFDARHFADARIRLESAMKYSPRLDYAQFWARELRALESDPAKKIDPTSTPYLSLIQSGGIESLRRRDGVLRLVPIDKLSKNNAELKSIVRHLCGRGD